MEKSKLGAVEMGWIRMLVCALLCVAGSGCSWMKRPDSAARAAPSFVAYGDMPYRIKLADGRTDEEVLERQIAPSIASRPDVAFAIHVGDVGRPEFACNDAYLDATVAFWKLKVQKPVFYTPGDNEWLDCDREKVPNRSSELGRLDAVRRILSLRDNGAPAAWRARKQEGQPENASWIYAGARFATLHVVSKGNGREQVLLDDPWVASAKAVERESLNDAWLAKAFEQAKSEGASVVVLAMQYDMFGPERGNLSALARCMESAAHAPLCARMDELARDSGLPVLLIHGDTNAYCLERARGFSGNVWRLNAPGDYKRIDAAVVSWAAGSARPFEVRGLLDAKPAPERCDYSR